MPRRAVRQTRSAEEVQDRIEFVAAMLAQGFYKGVIKAAIKQKYDVSARMCESYLARARAWNLKMAGRSAEEIRAKVRATLEAIIDDRLIGGARTTQRERIQAARALARFLPMQVDVATPAGIQVDFSAARERLKELAADPVAAELMGQLSKRAAGLVAARAASGDDHGGQNGSDGNGKATRNPGNGNASGHAEK